MLNCKVFFTTRNFRILCEKIGDFNTLRKELHTIKNCAAKNIDKKCWFFAQIHWFVQFWNVKSHFFACEKFSEKRCLQIYFTWDKNLSHV